MTTKAETVRAKAGKDETREPSRTMATTAGSTVAPSGSRVPGQRPRRESLSLAEARRIALAAQGFVDPKPSGQVTMRHLKRVIDRIAALQIDSVNVLQRAHYMPLFSRLGAYPTALLERAAGRAPRVLFEYWGHEASLLPVELHPYFRWRMARAREQAWGGMRDVAERRPELVSWVLAQVRERGPVTGTEIEEDKSQRTNHWGWNWSDTKRALEWLFWCGEVTAAGRNNAFARCYDVPERVLPAEVLNAPTPSEPEAMRELVRRSAAALGVAAELELRDYFRLPPAGARRAIAELVEEGTLVPVTVESWRAPAYLYATARLPRRVEAATLISPFDPLVWERARVERLFGFRYRIEIYTPAPQREYGYYVLPFLLGDRLVARVDLKADRRAGVLRVPGAWVEPGVPEGEVASALAGALQDLAGWLGLAAVDAPQHGNLSGVLPHIEVAAG